MVKIRLRRMGNRNRPFFRVVVSDSRKVPMAASVEEVGYYDPSRQPATVQIDRERIAEWVKRGAQMSPTVKQLVARG